MKVCMSDLDTTTIITRPILSHQNIAGRALGYFEKGKFVRRATTLKADGTDNGSGDHGNDSATAIIRAGFANIRESVGLPGRMGDTDGNDRNDHSDDSVASFNGSSLAADDRESAVARASVVAVSGAFTSFRHRDPQGLTLIIYPHFLLDTAA
jgi:hypothetical protein